MKAPRWTFEKFPQAERTLTTQMKSVGEAMAIGRTFKEAFLKGLRSLDIGRSGLLFARQPGSAAPEPGALRRSIVSPTDRRMWAVFEALAAGWSVDELYEASRIDRWFLTQFAEIVELYRRASSAGPEGLSKELLLELKRAGFGDEQLGAILDTGASAVAARRVAEGLRPVYKRIDTCGRRVRVVHAVPLRRLRDGVRGRAERPPEGRSSSAADRTGSGRASSSTTAVVMPRSRSARRATKPS